MSEVTVLLQRMDAGDSKAAEELLPLVHSELRRLAARSMRGQRSGHTLQPTALVHEAWIKLGGDSLGESFNGREHFLRTAARAMRQVLIDHARRRSADKRGGGSEEVDVDAEGLPDLNLNVTPETLLDIGAALDALEREDPELAELVELRYFGGYSMPEVADLQGVSLSTAERRWRLARAWLRNAL